MLSVHFDCGCGRRLEAEFWSNELRDIVHCDCGRKWLVPMPYVGHIQYINECAFEGAAAHHKEGETR